MKIAVNTRLLIKNQMDGIGYFTFETFRVLSLKHSEHQFIYIFDRKPHPDFITGKNIDFIVLSPQARHPILYKIWYQFALKKFLKQAQPDIFVATDGMFPLKTRTKVLSVIHDINFHHYPEFLPKKYAHFYNKYFSSFAKNATRIATVSNYSKQDIINTYQIEDDKIDIVYNGANENFRPLSQNKQNEIQKQHSLNCPYFLFVGTLHPRKNLIRLFQAFDDFKSKTNSNFKLLVVGKKMWWKGEVENAYLKLKFKDEIIFTGRVEQKELTEITASAYALTYIPIFEGFGIPLVEAMSCGVPTITSKLTSMPEVVEDAGILVNPFSVDEICNAMIKINRDTQLRNLLAEKSLIQSQKFSWEKTAHLLWKSILRTLETPFFK